MSYKSFDGVAEYGNSDMLNTIQYGLIYYLDWSFLSIGAFDNVLIPTSGSYGGFNQQLQLAYDPNYIDGQVWQGFRNNWIWESGVEYHNQPIQISGVNVNGTFYNTATTGAFSFSVDYPDGQVRFNKPISSNSTVQLAYSYRNVLVTTSDVPWFKEFMFDSNRSDSFQFSHSISGAWSILGQSRLQLPAVVVDVLPKRQYSGYSLGGGHWVKQAVAFYIFAELDWEGKNITDIIAKQADKTIFLLNLTNMGAATGFPLYIDGSLQPNAKTYPTLVNNFFLKEAYLSENTITSIGNITQSLWGATVQANVTFVEGNIGP